MSRFNSLALRIAVALPGIGLFAAVAILDTRILTALFFSVIAAAAAPETLNLMGASRDRLMVPVSVVLTFLGTLGVCLLDISLLPIILFLPGFLLSVLWVLRNGVVDSRRVVSGISVLTAVILLGMGLLARLGIDFESPWVMFIPLLICWVGDSAAYFAGSAFGKHKMFPSISPAKSWEGFTAGMAGSVLGAAVAGSAGAGFALSGMVMVGFAGGVAATAGDMLESALKRDADTKDSGSLLPGHGGILDRFDSLLVAVPAVWLAMTVLGSLGLL